MSETMEQQKRGGLRKVYDWMMSHAQGKHAWRALACFSFAEASFFPVPPDIMLVPMVLADRRRAFHLALWCTLWSVLGGIAGYAIGALLFDSLGQWVIQLYGYGKDFETFRAAYAHWGAWIIFLKGLTPIPYKLVTIASGFAGYNLTMFIVMSVLTRSLRFLMVAGLLYWFGEPVREFIEKKLEWVMLGVLVLVVLGFVAAKYLI